jgi:hypothetical protein
MSFALGQRERFPIAYHREALYRTIALRSYRKADCQLPFEQRQRADTLGSFTQAQTRVNSLADELLNFAACT